MNSARAELQNALCDLTKGPSKKHRFGPHMRNPETEKWDCYDKDMRKTVQGALQELEQSSPIDFSTCHALFDLDNTLYYTHRKASQLPTARKEIVSLLKWVHAQGIQCWIITARKIGVKRQDGKERGTKRVFEILESIGLKDLLNHKSNPLNVQCCPDDGYGIGETVPCMVAHFKSTMRHAVDFEYGPVVLSVGDCLWDITNKKKPWKDIDDDNVDVTELVAFVGHVSEDSGANIVWMSAKLPAPSEYECTRELVDVETL